MTPGTAVEDVSTSADNQTLANKINELIASLEAAGILQS